MTSFGGVIGEIAVRSANEAGDRGLFKVDNDKSEGTIVLESKRSASVGSWSRSLTSWLSFDCDRLLLVVEVFNRLAVEVFLLGMSSKTSMQKTTESRKKTGTPSGGRTSAAGVFGRTR